MMNIIAKTKQAFSILVVSLLILGQHTSIANAKQSQGGQFVRIGLNKSIVVRLPADAHDILVGNPDIVEAVVRTQRTAYLFAKKPGQTNAFFFDKNGKQILNLDIEVARDMKALQKLLQRIIPGNTITVETVGENIVLGGVAKSPAQAKLAFDLAAKYTDDPKKVLTTISVAGKEQVMLKVKVTEMQREVLKQFGINAGAVEKIGNATLNLFSTNPFSVAGKALSATQYGIGNAVNPTTGAIIRAMERDGFIKTLAEPNLTAISGESAKFLAGGEFPIATASSGGDIAVEYKPFGVAIGFTPVVLSHGRISLKLNTEVSDISPENSVTIGNLSLPAFEVRRAETTVELPSGGSLAMAGLIKEKTKQAINGLPGAKNLPVLGALFRSRDFASTRSELVIIVTPYIVTPVSARQLVTPIDKAVVATDTQTILFGRLNRVFGSRSGVNKGTYHGNVGFIVE